MKEPRETNTLTIPSETPIDNDRNQPIDTLQLSDEVWLHILSFLDPESLIKNVELLSTQFRNFANDAWIWKQLFRSYFPQEIPSPLPKDFNWKKEFITLYIEQYGFLKPETRKLISLIVAGNIDTIRTLNISIENLKADSLVLIKTATRLNQQAILEHFYSISEQEFQTKTENKNKLELLRWAVLRNRGQGDYTVPQTTKFAAEAGLLDLLLELLNSPKNPILENEIGVNSVYSSVICSGQIYMVRGINNFIAHHPSLAETNPYSAEILEATRPIVTAAQHGILPIFSRFTRQPQQEIVQEQQNVNEEMASSAPKVGRKGEFLRWFVAERMETAMLSAAEQGHIPIIKYALEKQLININQKLNADNTLLSRAALFHQSELVQFLLAKQADTEVALNELLVLDSIVGVEEESKDLHESMLSTLLDALEKRGKLNNTMLLSVAIDNDRVDILKRLFILVQETLLTISTIQTLLEKSGKNCEQFLKDKLEQARSKSAQSTAGTSGSSSVVEEPVKPTSYTNADNVSRFFKSSEAASQSTAN